MSRSVCKSLSPSIESTTIVSQAKLTKRSSSVSSFFTFNTTDEPSIETLVPEPPPFENNSFCHACKEEFGPFLGERRHHCRNCGQSYCGKCSTQSIYVPYDAYLNKNSNDTRIKQRVCDDCFIRIRQFHKQTGSDVVPWTGLPPLPKDQLAQDFPNHKNITQLWKTMNMSVYHCALMLEFQPFYGHIYLTSEHFCFKGYKRGKLLIPLTQIEKITKQELYHIQLIRIDMIESNSIDETEIKAETLFFAEFQGRRDRFYDRMQEIKLIDNEWHGKSETDVLLSSDTTSEITIPDEYDDEESEDEEILEDDEKLSGMTLLMDMNLPADINTVYALLFSNGNGQDFLFKTMTKAQDEDIQIGAWQPLDSQTSEEIDISSVKISTEKDYTLYRRITSKHAAKIQFPGLPSHTKMITLQRLRCEKKDNGKWTRFVISDTCRTENVPYCDYFTIESRIVCSRASGGKECRIQTGMVVNYSKSTWFESKINSSSLSEAKVVVDNYAKSALERLKQYKEERKQLQCIASTRNDVQVERKSSEPHAEPIPVVIQEESSVKEPSNEYDVSIENHMITTTPQSMLGRALKLRWQWIFVLVLIYCTYLIHLQNCRMDQLAATIAQLSEDRLAPTIASLETHTCSPLQQCSKSERTT